MENQNQVLAYPKKDFLAALGGISPTTFDKLVQDHGLPVVRIGRKVLVPAREAQEWLARHVGEDLFPDGVNGGKNN